MRQTCSSSSNYANLLQRSNIEGEAVENVRKIDSVAQSKVSELNSSCSRPLIRYTERIGLITALLRQILQIHVNWLILYFSAFLQCYINWRRDSVIYIISKNKAYLIVLYLATL